MIRVTVELLKHGDPNDVTHLGTAYIANEGSGTKTSGNYRVQLLKRNRARREVWRVGFVKDFPRIKRGPWDLLYLALRATVGDRWP